MLHTLRTWFSRLWGGEEAAATAPPPPTSPASEHQTNLDDAATTSNALQLAPLRPYDEHLLERARTQWQFGDWASLIQIDRDALPHHPDKVQLALLAAAGHLQAGQPETGKQLILQAQEWGCDKKAIARILMGGIHNSLGRASAVLGQTERAQLHFEGSVKTGMPEADSRLLAMARKNHQTMIKQQNLLNQGT